MERTVKWLIVLVADPRVRGALVALAGALAGAVIGPALPAPGDLLPAAPTVETVAPSVSNW